MVPKLFAQPFIWLGFLGGLWRMELGKKIRAGRFDLWIISAASSSPKMRSTSFGSHARSSDIAPVPTGIKPGIDVLCGVVSK